MTKDFRINKKKYVWPETCRLDENCKPRLSLIGSRSDRPRTIRPLFFRSFYGSRSYFIHVSFRSIRSHFRTKFRKLLRIDSFPSRFHIFRFAKLVDILLSCPKFNALRHYNAGDNKHQHVRRHNIRRISKGTKLSIVDCHVLFARIMQENGFVSHSQFSNKAVIETG